MTCNIIRELDSLYSFAQREGNLNCCVMQGLDFTRAQTDWEQLRCEGATFLGCRFPDGFDENTLRDKGATVIPRFKNLPYHAFRSELYTREELMEGWMPMADNSTDKKIYDHFHSHGGNNPDVLEAMSQRIHDHAIDDALRDLLEGRVERDGKKKVVAVMGGHGTSRTDAYYKKVAYITRSLTRAGYFIASGGGPGIMEAANLGAWLANAEDAVLDDALETLGHAPVYTDAGYMERAQEVIDMHPSGSSSLAVPTWFYGHEPTNLFSRYIAKYFSNSIREDGLLAIATYGVIYAPGSAGTTQEIFMDATQNHYVTFDWVSPMIFLGKKRYQEDTMLFDCISQLAQGMRYSEFLLCTDDENEVVAAIESYQPTAGK
ncbi:MAG: LOG family protein [Akkermansiaceae bacterium]